jgi:hypothetical protein
MKAAYVTLVTAENYFPGAVALIRSLKRTLTSYPFVVITTEGLCSNLQDQLRDLGAEVRCLPRMQVPATPIFTHHPIHSKVCSVLTLTASCHSPSLCAGLVGRLYKIEYV